MSRITLTAALTLFALLASAPVTASLRNCETVVQDLLHSRDNLMSALQDYGHTSEPQTLRLELLTADQLIKEYHKAACASPAKSADQSLKTLRDNVMNALQVQYPAIFQISMNTDQPFVHPTLKTLVEITYLIWIAE